MDASNSRTNNRRNNCISKVASNSMDKGKSMEAVTARILETVGAPSRAGTSATAGMPTIKMLKT
jgi:hypothetical protein